MANRYRKEDALIHWANLDGAPPLKPKSIPYKQAGSTYGADGIRIEGSQEFIDAVLSRLKDLLDYENGETRLGLNYTQVENKPGAKPYPFAGNWVCYVKVHQRGDEAQMMNAWLSAATGKEKRVNFS